MVERRIAAVGGGGGEIDLFSGDFCAIPNKMHVLHPSPIDLLQRALSALSLASSLPPLNVSVIYPPRTIFTRVYLFPSSS